MWATFSLFLTVLILVLSLRFYWSHCLPYSGQSGKVSSAVSKKLKAESTTLKPINTGMKPVSPSSGHDSTLLMNNVR